MYEKTVNNFYAIVIYGPYLDLNKVVHGCSDLLIYGNVPAITSTKAQCK